MIPRLDDPSEDLIDVLENVIRRGLPAYGITSPAWEGDDPCPAGHWFLPEETTLYRYDIPASLEPPSISIGLEQSASRRHSENSRYWDVPCMVIILWPRDLPANVWRTIRARLQAVFNHGVRDGGSIIPPRTYLSRGAVLLHYISNFQIEAIKEESRPATVLRFTAFCTARRTLTSPDGDLLTTPDGFTITH